MNLNKKTKALLFILSIIAITIISFILAYLTDKEQKINEFTIGSIDIKLEESAWDALPDVDNSGVPDAAEAMGPGETIAKDPKVVNQGRNDAYVYLKVEVPKAEIKVGEGNIERQELFTYSVHGDNWVLMPDLTVEDVDENKITYIYYYKNGIEDYLRAGATSETLFDSVTLKDITNFNGLSLEQQIVIKAYAIQMGEELTVTANPWISKFEEEKKLPEMQGARVLSSPTNTAIGWQVGDTITIGVVYNDFVTVTQAPSMTAGIADGEEFTVPYDGLETAGLEKKLKLAVSSRANGGVTTILKYKHVIQEGEVGEFKIKSFTGGELYTAKGKRITVEAVPLISEEEKVIITEQVVAKETIYDKITSNDYGTAIIEELPDYVLFYKGEVRNSECTEEETGTNKIVLIYKGYYPNSEIPGTTSTGPCITKAGNYRVYWGSGTGVTTAVQAVEKLNDSTWTESIVPETLRSKITATGGIGISTWIKSWNEKNSSNKVYKKYYASSGNGVAGWCVSTSVSSDSNVSNSSYNVNNLPTSNKLYFPHSGVVNDTTSSTPCYGSWLASPSGYNNAYLTRLSYNGKLGYNGDITIYTNYCVRPVVYLTSDIKGIKDKNETMWSIE